ncbi:MAG: glycoside hydrolase family 16 protein [Amnibacterium sp.]
MADPRNRPGLATRVGVIAAAAAVCLAALASLAFLRVGGAAVTAPGASQPVPGPAMPGNLPGWTRILGEDFSRPVPLGEFRSVYPHWSAYDGTTDTSRTLGRPWGEQGLWDSGTTSSVQGGVFDCAVHTPPNGPPQVCTLTPPLGGSPWAGRLYGRYSVRFRADAVPGYKVAWLLWPQSNRWPQGEIDFPEADLTGAITGSSHSVDGDPSQVAWKIDTGVAMSSGWHVATIEWTPGRLRFLLDGKVWSTTDPAALPTHPMRWALQTETQLSPAPPPADAAGHVQIDWVAIWRYDPGQKG